MVREYIFFTLVKYFHVQRSRDLKRNIFKIWFQILQVNKKILKIRKSKQKIIYFCIFQFFPHFSHLSRSYFYCLVKVYWKNILFLIKRRMEHSHKVFFSHSPVIHATRDSQRFKNSRPPLEEKRNLLFSLEESF